MNFFDSLEDFLNLNTFNRGHSHARTLMLHSNAGFVLRRIMRSSDSRNCLNEALVNLYHLLSKYVGHSGTMFFPGFFDEYARSGKPFDKSFSPPSKHMGSLPRFVFDHYSFARDANPLTNLMAVGGNFQSFCSEDSLEVHGYSQNSIWSKFSDLSTEILFLGVPPTYMTYLHFLEVSNSAPYLFNKYFDIPILDKERIVSRYSICPVRFRDSSIRWNFSKFINLSIEQGAIKIKSGSAGLISLVNSTHISKLFNEEFRKNPFFLLESKGVNYSNFQTNLETGLDGIALPNVHLEPMEKQK